MEMALAALVDDLLYQNIVKGCVSLSAAFGNGHAILLSLET